MKLGTSSVLLLILAVVSLSASASERDLLDGKSGVVQVTPQSELREIVARSPENTVFSFAPGVYRGIYIEPKNGQRFVGKDGVVLTGAMILDKWSRDGDFWVAEGLPEQLQPHGGCLKESPGCRFREDLFVNDQVFKRVLSRDQLDAVSWYYEAGKAYQLDDPSGKRIELSVTPRAFGGNASNVVLANLTVEKYASQAQAGAIDARHGKNWSFINVTARWNHGIGLFVGPGTRIEKGSYSHNGQMGLGGGGENILIDGPEIAHNNYAGFHYEWEAGGFKFFDTRNLIVRNACVHHNDGIGMWNDIDNIDTIFENNKVFDNARIGIAQEISYAAKIRNNVVARNGRNRDGWLWGSQILIQNSKDVEVYGNVVEVAATFGNGIGIINQNRGDGKYGSYEAMNNYIHDNQIIHLGVHGRSGVAVDFRSDWFLKEANNRFDRNTYLIPNPQGRHWMLDEGADWNKFRTSGMEPNGRIIVRKSGPMALSCNN